MPIDPLDGSLVQYTKAQIASWNLGTRGIDDGTNPEERFGPDGSGCTRRWLCNWANRFDAITYMLGQVVQYTNPVTGLNYLSRLPPQMHPTQPWACVSARLKGHLFIEDYDSDGTGGNLIPIFDAAEIEAEYSVYPVNNVYADGDITSEIQRYVTIPGMIGAEPVSKAEYVTYPNGIVTFKTPDGSRPNGSQIQTNVGMVFGEQEVKAIWRRLPPHVVSAGSTLFTRIFGNPTPGDPLPPVLPFVGTMNQTAIFGYPPLTLLLLTPEQHTIPDPTSADGQQLELTYRWLFRPQGHTNLYFFDAPRPAPPGGGAPSALVKANFYQVSRSDIAYKDPTTFNDGETLFNVRDHNLLFQLF